MARPQESSRTGPTYQLAEFMNRNWDASVGRTNEDVAGELGYRSANIISMWRTGRTRVPLDKLPGVARLMKLDMVALLPAWFEQQWGDRTDVAVLQKTILSRITTDREARLLSALREAVPAGGLEFTHDQIKAMVTVVTVPAIREGVLSMVAAA